MSTQTRAKWLGDFLGTMRQHADATKKEVKEAGYRMQSIEMLLPRIETLGKLMLYLQDDANAIQDKVKMMDFVLATIGMAWGKGAENEVWSTIYTKWNLLMQDWLRFLSQKYLYVVHQVQLEVLAQKLVIDARGNSHTQEEWEMETVDPTTAMQKFFNQPPEKETVRFLKIIETEPSQHDPDLPFSRQQIDRVIIEVGEIVMIRCGLQALNHVWYSVDVASQSTLLLQQMTGQQQPQTHVTIATQTEENE